MSGSSILPCIHWEWFDIKHVWDWKKTAWNAWVHCTEVTETTVTLMHGHHGHLKNWRRTLFICIALNDWQCKCTTKTAHVPLLMKHGRCCSLITWEIWSASHPLKLLCTSMLREQSSSLSSYSMEHWRENYGSQHQQTMGGNGIQALKHGCLTGHIWKMLVFPVHYFCTALATRLVRGGVNATKEG